MNVLASLLLVVHEPRSHLSSNKSFVRYQSCTPLCHRTCITAGLQAVLVLKHCSHAHLGEALLCHCPASTGMS